MYWARKSKYPSLFIDWIKSNYPKWQLAYKNFIAFNWEGHILADG